MLLFPSLLNQFLSTLRNTRSAYLRVCLLVVFLFCCISYLSLCCVLSFHIWTFAVLHCHVCLFCGIFNHHTLAEKMHMVLSADFQR